MSIAGHTCEGLSAHLEVGGGCTPNINEQGHVRGCDATNYVRVKFCPFCGTALDFPPVKLDGLKEYDDCPRCDAGTLNIEDDGALHCFTCKLTAPITQQENA